MEKMTQQELDKLIELHLLWLKNDSSGKKLNLTRKDLSELDFSSNNLCLSSLTACDIRYANFEGCNLSYCDFSNSNLMGSNFCNTCCVNASFAYCNLAFSFFSK